MLHQQTKEVDPSEKLRRDMVKLGRDSVFCTSIKDTNTSFAYINPVQTPVYVCVLMNVPNGFPSKARTVISAQLQTTEIYISLQTLFLGIRHS